MVTDVLETKGGSPPSDAVTTNEYDGRAGLDTNHIYPLIVFMSNTLGTPSPKSKTKIYLPKRWTYFQFYIMVFYSMCVIHD